MGEVYRATDTRLDRTVAVKILPDALAADPDRRLRFEREARTIASLSHPHICALHDVGSAHPADLPRPVEYLVMEYVEGETLGSRLVRGPLPLEEVIRYGTEIAAALEAAHRQRVVHRDLKPSNVMITRSGVKLLDFGLAKATRDSPAAESLMSTAAGDVSAPGLVIGTLPYMAPEQIEGREADARSDVFAFGAVLYEMATGRRAFPGESAPAIASAILAGEPPPAAISPSLDRIIRSCLRRDPEQRWQSAQDVGLQLREVPERDRLLASRDGKPARLLPWIVAGLTSALALAAVGYAARAQLRVDSSSAAAPLVPLRFVIPHPPDGFIPAGVERIPFAISPDGTRLAMATGVGDAPPSIRIRALSSETATDVPGTEWAMSMFWSPDGKSLAFFTGGKLKRVDLAGGAPLTVCDVPQGIGLTGTWGDGQILFASVQGERIMRVAASGGTPVEVARPDRSKGEDRVVWPSFLPDGRRFLYLSARGMEKGAVMLASPDGPARELLPLRTNAQYVGPGFLVYAQDDVLLARRLDLEAGQFTGEPIAIAEGVNHFVGTGLSQFSASQTGVLVFHSGTDITRLATFGRTGREAAQLRAAIPSHAIRLSPDGRELYLDRTDPKSSRIDLWKIELDRGGETRVTNEPAAAIDPAIARDGAMFFSAARQGRPMIVRRSSSGSDEFLVPQIEGLQMASDVSPDGGWLVYSQRVPRGNFDLMAVSLADRKAAPFHPSDSSESGGRFSPDGRYLAFTSDLGGRSDVYVAPFPGPGPMRIVSTTACTMPRWSADGRELFCIGVDGTVYAVPITTSPALEIGRPQALFTRGSKLRWVSYDAMRDGRFIALEPVSFAAQQPLHVVVNWAAQGLNGR